MNVIITDTGDTIGFAHDLKNNVLDDMKYFIGEENWEMVSTLSDIMVALQTWQDSPCLLVLSDNNGMGYTVREYTQNVTETPACETTSES